MQLAVPSAATTASRRWIVDARFDLAWVFGGAALALAFAGASLAWQAAIVPLTWAWILFFDGPHMAAAYSRTYADRDEWMRRPRRIVVPLLAFAVGPGVLVAGALAKSEVPFSLFLAVMTLLSHYHVARQHYGFVALYRARNGERGGLFVDRLATYGGTWIPYCAFVIQNPRARALAGLPPEGAASLPFFALVGAWVTVLVVFAVAEARRPAAERSAPKIAYVLLVAAMAGATYLGVGRIEPVFREAKTPDQEFVVLSMMASVFHATQYVALVWLHNDRHYVGERGDLARWMSAGPARYLGALFAFALAYVVLAAATGVYPRFGLLVGARIPLGASSISVNQLALSMWWGIALHHYWLDQRIWRIRGDAALARALGVGTRRAAPPRSP